MLFNDTGEILLIRNSVLPGGGIGRRESPEAAANREVREELGVAVSELDLIGTFRSGAEGKRDTIHLFKAAIDGPVRPDPIEIEEARFFSLDNLPASVSPATLRRIEGLQFRRSPDGRW